MPDELLAGQVTPANSEVTQTAPTPQVDTTDATTQGAEGEAKETAVEKTYSKAELQDLIERATAKASAKAERKAFREALETISRNKPEAVQPSTDDELPPRKEGEGDAAYVRRLVRTEVERGSVQSTQQTQAQKAEKIYAQAMKETGLERDDMQETAQKMTPMLSQALVDSDVAGSLLAYFATNPDELDRITNLSPPRQAAEVGKLELKLATPAVKTSKAPPPIDPIGSASTTVKSLATANLSDYEAMRRKQGARWASRR